MVFKALKESLTLVFSSLSEMDLGVGLAILRLSGFGFRVVRCRLWVLGFRLWVLGFRLSVLGLSVVGCRFIIYTNYLSSIPRRPSSLIRHTSSSRRPPLKTSPTPLIFSPFSCPLPVRL